MTCLIKQSFTVSSTIPLNLGINCSLLSFSFTGTRCDSIDSKRGLVPQKYWMLFNVIGSHFFFLTKLKASVKVKPLNVSEQKGLLVRKSLNLRPLEVELLISAPLDRDTTNLWPNPTSDNAASINLSPLLLLLERNWEKSINTIYFSDDWRRLFHISESLFLWYVPSFQTSASFISNEHEDNKTQEICLMTHIAKTETSA